MINTIISSNTLVALAHRLGFEGPIAGYRILPDETYGDHIELWDLHGRRAYADLAEPKAGLAGKKPAKPSRSKPSSLPNHPFP